MPGVQQNLTNHIALVLDASSSMQRHERGLVTAVDALIGYLARRSQERDQETRVTVYSFADKVQCLLWDTDVLRLPKIGGLYRPQGNTALIDATVQAVDDFGLIPEKYGDHGFLAYVFTDGEENASYNSGLKLPQRIDRLKGRLSGMPDNRTVAILVPNAQAAHEAKSFGFPAGNVAVWDTTSDRGAEEAVNTVQAATDTYMTMRSHSQATGVRSTKSLFDIGSAVVNAATVAATGLKPLPHSRFLLHPIPAIPDKTQVQAYVTGTLGLQFRLGSVFYQLMKKEKIQPGKAIAIMDNKTNEIFLGQSDDERREIRRLLGLPENMEVTVNPTSNPKYTIFIQSNSTNRHLVSHTRLLVMK